MAAQERHVAARFGGADTEEVDHALVSQPPEQREACLEFSAGREEGRGKAAQAEGSGEWHWGRWQGPLSCRVMEGGASTVGLRRLPCGSIIFAHAGASEVTCLH